MACISPRIKFVKLVSVVVGLVVLTGLVAILAMRWSVRANSASTLKDAERALRLRDNPKVRETLKWLLWFEPTQPRALLLQGISLNADRRFAEAIATLERIPESSSSFDEAEFALASSLIHDEQLDRAEAVLRRHLERYPQSTATCEELVRLNIRLVRQREATDLLLEFWNRGSDDFGALPLALELQVKPLTPHEAVASLEATNKKHPLQPMVILALARIYALLGKMELAKAHFETALQRNPHDLLTKITAAEFFLNRGETQSAQRLLNSESMALAKDDRLEFLRCRLAEQSGQLQEAYDHLQQALELRPNDESYVLLKATLLRRLGRIDEAQLAAKYATQLAETRKQLFVLSSQFDRANPNPELCLEIADKLERWGQQTQADAWRRVSRLITPSQSTTTIP